MSVENRPVAAFILSLIGGVFILLGAAIMSMFAFGTLNMSGMMGMMTGTMSGMYGGTGMGMMVGFAPVFSVLGFASGILVILGAVMLYSRPFESQLWGAIILAFSLVSILGGMGGFVVGLILGVVGGTLALTWKTKPEITAA